MILSSHRVVTSLSRHALVVLERRFEAEKTAGWRTPANRTHREYAARQALYALRNLRGWIDDYENACTRGGGSRSKQFEQVGNAIPPPLARAIIAELLR